MSLSTWVIIKPHSNFSPARHCLHDRPFSWPFYMAPTLRWENDYTKKVVPFNYMQNYCAIRRWKGPVFPTFCCQMHESISTRFICTRQIFCVSYDWLVLDRYCVLPMSSVSRTERIIHVDIAQFGERSTERLHGLSTGLYLQPEFITQFVSCTGNSTNKLQIFMKIKDKSFFC